MPGVAHLTMMRGCGFAGRLVGRMVVVVGHRLVGRRCVDPARE
jgi:hypothetical protein